LFNGSVVVTIFLVTLAMGVCGSGLAGDVRPGDRLLVDDGKIDLRVVEVSGVDITCEVMDGGPVSDHKGISLPGVDISVPALSEKDIEDLKFALELGADMVAMSFVRSPEEVKLAHAIMDEVGRRVPIIAKLEKPEAVSDLPAIVDRYQFPTWEAWRWEAGASAAFSQVNRPEQMWATAGVRRPAVEPFGGRFASRVRCVEVRRDSRPIRPCRRGPSRGSSTAWSPCRPSTSPPRS